MGRYFVVNASDGGDYITGEIVPDVELPGSPTPDAVHEQRRREGSLELERGSGDARILTLDQLLADPDGPRLLAAWQAGDDSRHDEDQIGWRSKDIREDIKMMAERKGDPIAQELLRRDAPLAELVAYIHEEASYPD
jgi:hypothetical protein